MSLGALVQQVGQVLGRAHSLFGDPPASGGSAALDAGSGLAAAGNVVRGGQVRMAELSGALPDKYGGFATEAGAALDGAAGTDNSLSGQLSDAAGTDRSGRASSGAVVNGAATDTSSLSPLTGTPAGQRALVAALRARVAEQQQVVNAHKAQDARLAAMVRSLAYSQRRSAGGGASMGGMPFGGGGFGGGGGGSPFSGLSGLSGLSGIGGGDRNPRTALMSKVDWTNGGGPGEPGQGAAQAALSKLGAPYVWGAKGPRSFDCSGLTQWAWRQAGVNIGGDTYSQIRDGVPVPPGQVRAGDLIFPLQYFGEGRAAGPGHVMMAINDHQCVHAPTTGDVVRIAPMPGRYVARRPVRPMAV